MQGIIIVLFLATTHLNTLERQPASGFTRLFDKNASWSTIASFPGPAQLSITVLQVTERWAGPVKRLGVLNILSLPMPVSATTHSTKLDSLKK